MTDTTTETTVEQSTTIRMFVPDGAGETSPDATGETVMETLKHRAAEAYGGYTTYSATGGWESPDGALVEENVTVLEVTAREGCDIQPETWAKVNARWVFRATDEQMVMATVGNATVTVTAE